MQKLENLTWPGGEHDFLLGIGQIRALQDKCDAGPGFILERLRTGRFWLDDAMQTIRLGLIGAGMDKDEARKLVDRFFGERPLAEFVLPAQLILSAAIYGVEDDPVGELPAGENDEISNLSREVKSDGPDSTEPVLPSDSRRETSTK